MYYKFIVAVIVGIVIGMMVPPFFKEGFQSTAGSSSGSTAGSSSGSTAGSGSAAIPVEIIKTEFPSICDRLDTLLKTGISNFDSPPPPNVMQMSKEDLDKTMANLKETHIKLIKQKKIEFECP